MSPPREIFINSTPSDSRDLTLFILLLSITMLTVLSIRTSFCLEPTNIYSVLATLRLSCWLSTRDLCFWDLCLTLFQNQVKWQIIGSCLVTQCFFFLFCYYFSSHIFLIKLNESKTKTAIHAAPSYLRRIQDFSKGVQNDFEGGSMITFLNNSAQYRFCHDLSVF